MLLEPITKHPPHVLLAQAPQLMVDIPLKMIELDTGSAKTHGEPMIIVRLIEMSNMQHVNGVGLKVYVGSGTCFCSTIPGGLGRQAALADYP